MARKVRSYALSHGHCYHHLTYDPSDNNIEVSTLLQENRSMVLIMLQICICNPSLAPVYGVYNVVHSIHNPSLSSSLLRMLLQANLSMVLIIL